jgi:hypothetical protein
MNNNSDYIKQALKIFENFDVTEGSLIVLAVEMDKDGVLLTRAVKTAGTLGLLLGSINIMQNMIDNINIEHLEKMEKELVDADDEVINLLEKLNIDFKDLKDPKKIDDVINNPDNEANIKKLIKNLKKKFGK